MNWKIIRDILVKHLKGEIFKLALKKILGSAAAGGIKAYLVKLVVEYLYEVIAVPIINLTFRKGLLFYDKAEAKLVLKKITEAKENKNKEDYIKYISRI